MNKLTDKEMTILEKLVDNCNMENRPILIEISLKNIIYVYTPVEELPYVIIELSELRHKKIKFVGTRDIEYDKKAKIHKLDFEKKVVHRF